MDFIKMKWVELLKRIKNIKKNTKYMIGKEKSYKNNSR
jgi:hypothetical protein